MDNERFQQIAGSQNIPSSPLTEVSEAEKELYRAVAGAHEILAQATTVFPFTLFPDTITVDREKLTITKRRFFASAEVVSFGIDDMLNVTAQTGPLFGSINVTTRFFDRRPVVIKYLRRHEAIQIKCIIEGYIIAIKKKIDCSTMPTPELRQLLGELGGGEYAGLKV